MPRRRIRARLRSQAVEPLQPEPSFHTLLRECFRLDLATVASPKVALISDRDRSRTEQWLLMERPDLRLVRLAPADGGEDGEDGEDGEGALHAELAAVGRFDLILDESENWTRFSRASQIFLYLRPGGVLLLRQPRPAARRRSPEAAHLFRRERRSFAALASAAGAGVVEFERRPKARPKSTSMYLGRAIEEFVVRDGNVKLVNRSEAWPKIREEWSPRLFAVRGSDFGSIQESSACQVFESRAQMSYSEAERHAPDPTSWPVPALYLRDYHDVVSSPGQVLYKEDVILPETYRHNQKRLLRNQFVTSMTPRFADPRTESRTGEPPSKAGLPVLPGSYYYLDSEYPAHFGHLLTEGLSRLWAWPERKAADPNLKLLVHPKALREIPGFERKVYEAGGVHEADIVSSRDPVRVEHLIGVTPMFSNPAYVHPGIAEVWDRIGQELAAGAPARDRPRRIFVARGPQLKRRCLNDADVRAFFVNLGFTVVFPEEHPLPEQIMLFRDAEVIAGYAGSAMFTLLFCPNPKQVVLVRSESYRHSNESLIAAVRGHQVHVAWCRSEATYRDDGTPMPGSQHVPFTFNFEREGEFVRAALA